MHLQSVRRRPTAWAIAICLAGGCAYNWDGLDPRLNRDGSLDVADATANPDSAAPCGALDGTCCSTADGGAPCSPGLVCMGARCRAMCALNQTACRGVCTDLAMDVGNCAMCGRACPAGGANAVAQCRMGVCGVMCSTGFGDCDGMPGTGCETPLTTVTNCGMCGRSCPSATGAPAVCTAGMCALMCPAGMGDCDRMAPNGCETPLNTAMNCAACARACTGTNATASCATGSCMLTCNAGFDDCDGMASNGCETPLDSNANCGMCRNRCMGGRMCVMGACV